MNSPQFIYNLISFSEEYIDGCKRIHEKNKDYEALQTKEEKEEYRKNYKGEPDKSFVGGKSYRGSWLDKDELINLIKEHGYDSICECYYTYLVIEKVYLNSLDGLGCFDEDGETWFCLKNTEEDEWEYEQINKPECFLRTCGFT